jgi:hypothetical protein
MKTLVVPGVQVEARFDVLPPLPAPSGILGAAGIVDRIPAGGGLLSVTKVTELRELLGPGTEVTMPEVVSALANGASEAVIAPVAGGGPASLNLLNADSNPSVTLRCRSNGAWPNNRLFADIQTIADAEGKPVRVSLRLLIDKVAVETFSDLQVLAGQPDDIFETINGRSRYVVALDPGLANLLPKAGTYAFATEGAPLSVQGDGTTKPLFDLLPSDEASPAGLSVKIELTGAVAKLEVFQGGLQEQFTDLTMNPDDNNFLPAVLLQQSRLVRARGVSSLAADKRLPIATTAPQPFAGGTSPTPSAYQDAIDLLADDTRIDLVLASIEPTRSNVEVRQIHQMLLAHAVLMTNNGAPRIAFGSLTADEQKKAPDRLNKIRDHAAAIRNRRFVLVAPAGGEGAVAGMVGRLNPQDAPTFKSCPLFAIPPATFRESELNVLLGPTTNLLVVQDRVGRGVVVLKGIDTTGDQVSVTRVADQAIRETKAISENFIGQLNTNDARLALKQQIIATFIRLERAGAIVPSTDGKDPAFVVDVYSTQQDFAQGIVRIDIAVRPVRAIDYIYATIRVKN